MSKFFIERPIFAGVISIIIVLAGLIAAKVLPIAQYPEIAPPTVTITANYPGASAETLAKTVAAPIEEQLSGVENLVYFSSSSASNGALTITATFEVGTDVDKAVIDVNNRVAIALPRLPDDVRRNGVVAQKRSTDILFVVALSLERPALRHAVPVELRDGQRARRAEARPGRRRRDDLRRARLLDAHLAAVRTGWRSSASRPTDSPAPSARRTTSTRQARSAQEPAPPGQALVYTVTARGRLIEPEEFGNIVLRSSGPGGTLRLKDVARIELGALSYDAFTTLDGKPTIGIAVFLQSGANALEVADRGARDDGPARRSRFPQGVSYIIPFDTTRFVQASIHEVIKTLLIAAAARDPRRLRVPAELARDADPDDRRAGVADRRVRRPLPLRLLDQHADAVRDRARHRHRRRRRDRRAGERRAADGRAQAVAEGRGDRVDARGDGRDHRDRAGARARCSSRSRSWAASPASSTSSSRSPWPRPSSISGLVALTLTPALCALLLKPQHEEPALFRPFNRGFAWLTRDVTSAASACRCGTVVGSLIVFVGVIGARGACCSGSSRRASCRPRTRATSSARSSCPMARRSAHRPGGRQAAEDGLRNILRSSTCSSSPAST